MDAVEMPLPANIQVPKLLTSKGFHGLEAGVEEADSLDFPLQSAKGPNYVSVTAAAAAAACTSSTREKKIAITDTDHMLVSQSKRIDFEFGMHEGLVSNCQIEDCGNPFKAREANNSFSSLPNCDSRLQNQRAEKISRSGNSCSKRPRKAQVEVFTSFARARNCDIMTENGEFTSKSISAEKSRVVKQKIIRDGRRGDKRLCKAAVKSKYDSFLSKSCFKSPASTTSVNNIYGLCGLKSDIHDVAKHVDELSLNEILDGSYKLPTPCPPKGKRASNSNENILCSIRKACSILPQHDAVGSQQAVADSSGNKGMYACVVSYGSHAISQNDQNSDKDIIMEDFSPSIQGSSNCGAATIPSDSVICQPKDVLERLTFSPIKDMDSLLQDTSGPGISSQSAASNLHIATYIKSTLPPLPWSLSVGGNCKPNTDSGKVISNRTACQSKWVRIGNSISWHENAKSCLAILDLVQQNHIIVPSGEQKITSSPKHEVHSVAVRIPDYGQVGPSHSVISALVTHTSDRTMLRKSGIFSSSHPEFNLPEKITDLSDSNLNEPRFPIKQEAKGNLRHHVNEAIIIKPQSLLLPEQEHIYADMVESKSNCSHIISGGCSPPQSRHSKCFFHLPPQVNSQAGSSPRLLAAAKILCELACDSNIMWKQGQNSGKLKWPKKSSQKTIKSLKLVPSEMMRAARVPKSTPKAGRLVNSTDEISPGYKFLSIDERIQTDRKHTSEGINWSVPTVRRVTNNSKNNLVKTTNQQNVDSTRLLGTMVSLARTEKVNFNQQKLWKASTTALCGKERSGGKSNKE